MESLGVTSKRTDLSGSVVVRVLFKSFLIKVQAKLVGLITEGFKNL